MRYSAEHKANTHRRIVKNAARQLRAKGLSGPGVATVMHGSGLTVGGFYKHFRSKDDLLVQAIEESFSEFRDKQMALLEHVPPSERWKEIVKWYLSLEHCEHIETGCPIAALATEIVRSGLPVRRRMAGLMKSRRQQLAPFMPGRTAAERENNFLLIFTAMNGAISMARIMPDAADKQGILDAVRDHLLASF